jgi:hypothetical protein
MEATKMENKKIESALDMLIMLLMVICFIAGGLLGYSIKADKTTQATSKTAILNRPIPPRKVFIRGDEWDIVFGFIKMSDGVPIDAYLDKQNAEGATFCAQKIIIIHTGQTLTDERDTMYHELLHAGACVVYPKDDIHFYDSKSRSDHEGFERISSFTVDLFHQNRELEKYLFED